MSDVFISYARPSEEQAKNVEYALRDEGYEVWRDAQLPAHQAYAEVIDEKLRSAKAVVVLWSAEAAKSQWVRAEADVARELGTRFRRVSIRPYRQCRSIKSSAPISRAGWEAPIIRGG